MAAAATEPTARAREGHAVQFETRMDAAAEVVEVPICAYSAYEPGVIVAQKFQLVRILGEGGMGSVWVAKNLALDVHVALKLIRAELARSVPGLEERLLQEARAAASIEHPAVIKIFDFGLTELRDPFIAMELLHGESLAGTVKRRGKVNAVRAVQTLLPITEALLAAHERGIVHRDLKPDNIFLARGAGDRLEPKVLDFGIAKFQQTAAAPNLTSAGTVLGSPAYMSPEQARGETDVDGRTDVWALCVVLYEVITGQLPFGGDNYNALLFSILEGQPKSFTDLGISEPLLWSIIARGLEKDRQRRCPNMFELGRALAIWLLDRGIQEDVCHSVLRSKWLERGAHHAASARKSFFPTDPPPDDEARHTLISGEQHLLPIDQNGKLSSGVLLRPLGYPTSNVFGVPYSAKLQTTTQSARQAQPSGLARLRATARERWVWLTVIGALASFCVAVALQALSSSASREDDELPALPVVVNQERRPWRAPAETTVESIVEMPRPGTPRLAPELAPLPSSRRAATVEPQGRGSEARPTSTRPLAQKAFRAGEPKPARSDLKNPFR